MQYDCIKRIPECLTTVKERWRNPEVGVAFHSCFSFKQLTKTSTFNWFGGIQLRPFQLNVLDRSNVWDITIFAFASRGTISKAMFTMKTP